ncbi:MAG: hypothetical protein ACRCZB_04235 [Bacteroidales bacterium]
MLTVLDALKNGVSNYPIPKATLKRVALVREIKLDEEATSELLKSKEYRLADADIKVFVATSSNVSQGGMNFDILYSTRETLLLQANAVYYEYGDIAYDPSKPVVSKVKYGYKGSRL